MSIHAFDALALLQCLIVVVCMVLAYRMKSQYLATASMLMAADTMINYATVEWARFAIYAALAFLAWPLVRGRYSKVLRGLALGGLGLRFLLAALPVLLPK